MPEAPAPSTGRNGRKKGSEKDINIEVLKVMNQIPHEFAIGGIFMPPLLVAGILGAIAAVITAHLLNRYRLSMYFFYPPLVSLALMIIYTVFIGTFIIGV
jgi:hypothetical protein